MSERHESVSASLVRDKCQELVSLNPGSVVLFIYDCVSDDEDSRVERNMKFQIKDNPGQQSQEVTYFSGNANGLESSLFRIIQDFKSHISQSKPPHAEYPHMIEQPWCCFPVYTDDMDTRPNEPETTICNKENVSKLCKELAELEPPGYTSSTLLVYVPPSGNDPPTNNVSSYPEGVENSEEGQLLIFSHR